MGGRERNDEIHRPISDSHYGKLSLGYAHANAQEMHIKNLTEVRPYCFLSGFFRAKSGVFMKHPKCGGFHNSKITQRACLVLYSFHLHKPRQAVIIQAANAIHAGSPLRSHTYEHIKSGRRIRPDFHDHIVVIIRTKAEGVIYGDFRRIECLGKRY